MNCNTKQRADLAKLAYINARYVVAKRAGLMKLQLRNLRSA